MVRAFTLNIGQRLLNLQILQMYTNLLCNYLLDVQILNDNTTNSYAPILNALYQSQLKKLKRINPPSEFSPLGLVDYTICILLSKENIEKITILERLGAPDLTAIRSIHFDLLFPVLHQFNKLTRLNISRATTVNTQPLEYILKSCTSLVEFSFDVLLNDNTIGITNEAILTLNPAPNIKILNCRSALSPDYILLNCNRHKSPFIGLYRQNQIIRYQKCLFAKRSDFKSSEKTLGDNYGTWKSTCKFNLRS